MAEGLGGKAEPAAAGGKDSAGAKKSGKAAAPRWPLAQTIRAASPLSPRVCEFTCTIRVHVPECRLHANEWSQSDQVSTCLLSRNLHVEGLQDVL